MRTVKETTPKLLEHIALAAIALLFTGMAVVGMRWGLPTREIDRYLFPDGDVWPGEKIYRLAGAAAKLSPESIQHRGADVDIDPVRERRTHVTDGDADRTNERTGARDTRETSASERPPADRFSAPSSRRPFDPQALEGRGFIHLTDTDEEVARIYLRYRLYTYQPDEMITMMALAGMSPKQFRFDPRLYQYGGLFIYPVGALIATAGAAGLIDVRGDIVYYLDNPDEFGKFYIVARAYSAAWGLVGVFVVFAIARRLAGSRVALLAALLFTLLPVVVCMAHEGKPHLPGAVLMLMAVLFAMRHLSRVRRTAGFSPRGQSLAVRGSATESSPRELTLDDSRKGEVFAAHGDRRRNGDSQSPERNRRDWWIMCLCCGAAFGMVLSSWPIFVLVPMVAWLERCTPRRWVSRTLLGLCLGIIVYLVTNPYVLINAFVNREVLASNFGNSLAMYRVDRIIEGLMRGAELTAEGAALPVAVLGVFGLIAVLIRSMRSRCPIDGATQPPGASCLNETSLARRVGGKKRLESVPESERAAGFSLRRDSTGSSIDGPAASALVVVSLLVPAAVFFIQFIMIGAGKPAEYGRFAIFPDAALAIGAACLLGFRERRRSFVNRAGRFAIALVVIVWVGRVSFFYLMGFSADAQLRGSRIYAADLLCFDPPVHTGIARNGRLPIGVASEPAPYCCPPLNFQRDDIWLFPNNQSAELSALQNPGRMVAVRTIEGLPRPQWWSNPRVLLSPIVIRFWLYRHLGERSRAELRETPISWANKPFEVLNAARTPTRLTIR